MKIYQKSPQTLGINPFFSTNSSVSTGESQRVTSRVNSSSINGVSDFNNVEPNNNISNQLENTSMRNSISNIQPSIIQTSSKYDLSVDIKGINELNSMIEFLRIKEDLSSDLEIRQRDFKLLRMLYDFVNEYGFQQYDVISKNHQINKIENSNLNNVYRNTYYKKSDKIGYVEGFLVSKENPNEMFYHSWNLSTEGEFIDFTLRESSEYVYKGIVIDNEIVKMVTQRIQEQENRKGYVHLPILPFLDFQEVSKVNKKRGGTVS